MRCWKCGAALNAGENVFRNSICPNCGADLHSCKGCRFYEQGAHYDCRETVEEQVTEKTRANFCDFFAPRENGSGVNAAATFAANSNRAAKARAAFNSLFGD